jgi:hypothetical protein
LGTCALTKKKKLFNKAKNRLSAGDEISVGGFSFLVHHDKKIFGVYWIRFGFRIKHPPSKRENY